MEPDLATTNALLGVMAAASLLEALTLIGLCIGGFLLYRRMIRVMAGIDERHVAPTVSRVNAILDDETGEHVRGWSRRESQSAGRRQV